MATQRRLIPDPTGKVTAVSASGVTMTEGNDSCHSALDSFAGPYNSVMEAFSNNRVTLGGMVSDGGRQLVGKMKNGR